MVPPFENVPGESPLDHVRNSLCRMGTSRLLTVSDTCLFLFASSRPVLLVSVLVSGEQMFTSSIALRRE